MGVYSPAVECYEIADSLRENWVGNNPTASVSLIVDWNKRHALVKDLLTNKRAYPYNDTAPAPLFVNGASLTNLSQAKQSQINQSGKYESAVVSVTYGLEAAFGPLVGSIKILDGNKIVVTEQIVSYSQFEDLDPLLFSTTATGYNPPDDKYPFGAVRRGLRLERTHSELVSIPTEVLDLPDTVNKDSYTSSLLGLTFAAETLRFGDVRVSRNFSRNLNPINSLIDLTLVFDYNPLGWNKFPRIEIPAGPGPSTIKFSDVTKKFYVSNPFADNNPEWIPYEPIDYTSKWLF